MTQEEFCHKASAYKVLKGYDSFMTLLNILYHVVCENVIKEV